MISTRTKAALAAAKAKGTKLGNPARGDRGGARQAVVAAARAGLTALVLDDDDVFFTGCRLARIRRLGR